MPPSSKRTRSSVTPIGDADDSPSSTPAPSAPVTRSSSHTRRPSVTPVPPPAPATQASPPRPILTRSAATQAIAPSRAGNPGLSRSNSFATPSMTTRRAGAGAGAGVGLGIQMHLAQAHAPSGSIVVGVGVGVGRATLQRTQSSPLLASPQSVKSVASSGGTPGRGKGDPEPDFGPGGRPWGRGKENVPPKPDEDEGEGSSRKRPRILRKSSGSISGRGRSGSVSSLRSESTMSLRDSVAMTPGHRGSRLPSPSPSMLSISTPSLDSNASSDPMESVHTDDASMDVDVTPSKRRATRRPLPPTPTSVSRTPSSESERDVDVTVSKMSLVRMQSHSSASSCASFDSTETETEPSAAATGPKTNPYKWLKSFLRLSATSRATDGATTVDQTIVGRSKEKAALRRYLMCREYGDVGMYVSGPPGTGKTATVTAIGREMTNLGWQVAEVGCMGLKVADMWARLSAELGCGASEEEVLAHMERGGGKTFVILDEIDSLLPPPPATPTPAVSHLLSKLFSLPLDTTAHIKLVAISNTLDLTLRARLALREGLEPVILPFQAYSAADMVDIVAARLSAAMQGRDDAAQVDGKAVELLTKKVEAGSGDLRMCLGCLTSAVSLAEAEWSKKAAQLQGPVTDSPPAPTPLIKVSLPHVIKAFANYTQQLKAAAGSGTAGALNPTGKKIRSVTLQGKMVLVCMLIYMARSNVGLSTGHSMGTSSALSSTPSSTPTKGDMMTFSSLYATYSYLLSHDSSPFPPATEADYRDLLSNLEVLGLISITGAASASMVRSGSSTSARGKGKDGRIHVVAKDKEIKAGLGLVDGAKRGVAEDEVGKVWDREAQRIERAVEKLRLAREREAQGPVSGFDE